MKKIKTADIQARMVSHNAVISDIRVGDDMIGIPDDKAILTVVIAGQQTAAGKLVVLFANDAPYGIKLITGT